jgi:glycosyltransferase involved in cell wall biosynthesis
MLDSQSPSTGVSARADLHVHSKYSDRPSEWLLRRIGAPESFTEPLDIYRRARERGMDFVTVTDHNSIDAALEIAHLPGTFLGCEFTTYFPENGAKVHCLAWGMSESQFREIQILRKSIYDFRRYLLDQDIAHSLAHPLFRVNDALTVDQVEKLLLLFNRFEGINGARDGRAAALVRAVFRHLTPDMIARMADRHGIEPIGACPWEKTFTGGSDDHGGIYIASAWTATPPARSSDEFLEHIASGNHEMGGASGTSLRLAHSFYQIAYSFYKTRLLDDSAKPNLLGELFGHLLDRQQPAQPAATERLRGLAGRLWSARWIRRMNPVEQSLLGDLGALLTQRQQDRGVPPVPEPADDQRSFRMACDVSGQLGYAFLNRLVGYLREGRLVESLQTFASLGPVAMGVAPYLAAFHTQHKDERFLQTIATHFESAGHLRLRSDRRAWFTDTFDDTNGVVRTIRALGQAAKAAGKPLRIITSLARPQSVPEVHLVNFPPLGEFELPEYESQKLAMPPLLEVIEHLEREQYSEVIISTPGPMGFVALAAARLLGLRTTGMYHTDFPRYVRHLTQDESMVRTTAWFTQWFYGQMDTVIVPSEFYRNQLVEHGLSTARVRVLGHGVDTELFHPRRRRTDFWSRWGIEGGFHFLYAGRLSREKNLDLLFEAFQQIKADRPDVNLLVAGSGPLAAELEQRWGPRGVVFTGWLTGEELATAYASADAFVFPSTTDTFGNAVLEAQASGLPAIVSHRGGPQEIVRRHDSGLVVNVSHPSALADAMRLLASGAGLERLKRRALENARENSWEKIFETFWSYEPAEDAQSLEPCMADNIPVAMDVA